MINGQNLTLEGIARDSAAGLQDASVTGGAVASIPYDILLEQPTTAAKNITTTASSLFVSTAAKTNRRGMIVVNNSGGTVYFGNSAVTTADGMPLLDGCSVEFKFSPATAVAVYFIASSTLEVRVLEY